MQTSRIVSNASMDGRYYGFRTSTDIQCGLRIVRGQTGSCVGETVREARESIRWTVKTFDSRGW
jgi:hypothetical protein